MDLERRYADLKRREIASGEQYVNSVFKYATTAAAIYGLYKTPLGQAVGTAIKSKIKR